MTYVDQAVAELKQLEIGSAAAEARGDNFNNTSSPRLSIDSGVSPTGDRTPVIQLIGQTSEDELPESRAEFDADSGVELPSVSRLRSMFNVAGMEQDDGQSSNFKRVSIYDEVYFDGDGNSLDD